MLATVKWTIPNTTRKTVARYRCVFTQKLNYNMLCWITSPFELRSSMLPSACLLFNRCPLALVPLYRLVVPITVMQVNSPRRAVHFTTVIVLHSLKHMHPNTKIRKIGNHSNDVWLVIVPLFNISPTITYFCCSISGITVNPRLPPNF